MEWLVYIFILIGTYLGLMLGILLCHIASEEVSVVAKYLKYLDMVVIASIFFLTFMDTNLIAASLIAVAILIILYFLRGKYDNYVIYVTYAIMGIFLAVGATRGNLLNTAVLTVLLGMSVATTQMHKYSSKRQKSRLSTEFTMKMDLARNLMFKNSGFLILGIIAFVIISYLI